MTEQTDTPVLRFKSFNDKWSSSTIGALGDFYYGKSAPKWSITEDVGIPCIRYGELYTKFNNVVNEIYSYTSMPKEKLRFSKGGEILIPRVGEDPLDFAKCVYLPQKDIAIGEMISVYNTKENPLFLTYYFNTKMKYEFAKRVEGASVSNLYYSYLEDIKLKIPDIREQEKLGEFFSKLDQQIELEEKKLELLEQQKKGYMQKIFSQELRFKDKKDNYYSDWKNCQLKDLTYYKNGKGYEKVATTNGKYNIINLNSIGIKGQLKDSGKYTDFEDDTLLKNDLIMILSDVAKGNLIGMTAIIDEDNKYLLNQRIALLRIKNSLITNAYFLYLYINFNRKYFINMSAGMSQLNINKKTVEDFPVNLPNIEEQNKIAILFKNYGDTIKKQASKVKLLKQRKQGLLQKMFV